MRDTRRNAGTEILQFSPTAELVVLEGAIAEWMSAQQRATS